MIICMNTLYIKQRVWKKPKYLTDSNVKGILNIFFAQRDQIFCVATTTKEKYKF